jgi:hypothetical protein
MAVSAMNHGRDARATDNSPNRRRSDLQLAPFVEHEDVLFVDSVEDAVDETG